MAELVPVGADQLARDAVEGLRRARARLDMIDGSAESNEVRWEVLDDAADQLAQAASHPACPIALCAVLLDWRDRLGSCVLAARALADLDVHPDVAEQLLHRGLDEAIQESSQRFLDMPVRLMAPPTPVR